MYQHTTVGQSVTYPVTSISLLHFGSTQITQRQRQRWNFICEVTISFWGQGKKIFTRLSSCIMYHDIMSLNAYWSPQFRDLVWLWIMLRHKASSLWLRGLDFSWEKRDLQMVNQGYHLPGCPGYSVHIVAIIVLTHYYLLIMFPAKARRWVTHFLM